MRWYGTCNEGYLIWIQIQIFLFPIKEPFRAEQLTKNLIQWLWIDYIDWKMTTFYETNKSKFNHTIDIVIVAFECMIWYRMLLYASRLLEQNKFQQILSFNYTVVTCYIVWVKEWLLFNAKWAIVIWPQKLCWSYNVRVLSSSSVCRQNGFHAVT